LEKLSVICFDPFNLLLLGNANVFVTPAPAVSS